MTTIYVYVLDTMADWELGHVVSELHSGRYFKKDAGRVQVKTISNSKEPIHTMGGLTLLPDGAVDDIVVDKANMLLLPGANTWSDPIHHAVLQKAGEFLRIQAPVGAICGATVALANLGLLDQRAHTSNGPGFLEMCSPGYKGQSFYVDQPAVADGNLFTAAGTGALLWAKQIIGYLEVFQPDTLEAWYEFFRTGEPKHFFALMQTLPSGDEN